MPNPSSPSSRTAPPAAVGIGAGLLLLLGLLMALAPLAIDMYLPTLPAIAAELHASSGAVQATLATYLAGMAGGQLVYGTLADRFGRRLPLLAGLALFTLASLGCAQAHSVGELLTWRLLQALGGCVGVVMPMTIVADRVRSDADTARVMSHLMAVLGLAPIAAPSLGGAVQAWVGWRGIFVLLALVAALAWLLVWRTLPETLPVSARQRPPQGWSAVLDGYMRLMRQRRFVVPALAGAMSRAGMFVYISASAFVLIRHYGLSPQSFGVVFAANALTLVVAAQVNARLVRRHAPRDILRWSMPAMAAAGLFLALLGLLNIGALWAMLTGLVTFLAALAFVTANTTALAMSGHEQQQRGTASGLLGTLQFACGAVAGALVGLVGEAGPLAMGVGIATCALLAWWTMRQSPASAD